MPDISIPRRKHLSGLKMIRIENYELATNTHLEKILELPTLKKIKKELFLLSNDFFYKYFMIPTTKSFYIHGGKQAWQNQN